jgi:hypothetical protein
MELVCGESVRAWLRRARRSPAEIVEVFIAAARGLAAAHAAGMVHRDFKPHNVLRGADGRIAVTDFGLARRVDEAMPFALQDTAPVRRSRCATGGLGSANDPLTGNQAGNLTGNLTGDDVVLGTPGYMAPEQWACEKITPAADQFAFCVALWEALAGQRPYNGDNLRQLRWRIQCGPTRLDASRIPRGLRGLLRRGLQPNAAERWPSMAAVIDQLERVRRRPRAAFALAKLALAGAVMAGVVTAGYREPPPPTACEAPTREVSAAWSPALAAGFAGATSSAHADVLTSELRDWHAAREAACAAPPAMRRAQLACLDGILDRVSLLRTVFERVPGASAELLQAQMVDPAICRGLDSKEVPRLTLGPASDMLEAHELYVRSETDALPAEDEIASLIDEPGADPCARIVATFAFDNVSHDEARRRARMAEAIDLAERCADDRVRADLMIRDAPYHWDQPLIGRHGELAIARAESAADRVMQPDLAAAIANQRALAAAQAQHWDTAAELSARAFDGFAARGITLGQLATVLERDILALQHGSPDDFPKVIDDVAHWQPLALTSRHAELARELGIVAGLAEFRLGHTAAAHDALVALWRGQPRIDAGHGRRITGVVVDAHGRPVAGAEVAVAAPLVADSVRVGLPDIALHDHLRDTTLRLATTDARGQFAIDDAAVTSTIVAQRGDRRSRPIAIADHLRIVVEPTRTLRGKVEIGDTPYTLVTIWCTEVDDPTGRYFLVAPVAEDGSFTIAGASTGALRIGAVLRDPGDLNGRVRYQAQPASPAPVTGLALHLPAGGRALDVMVRSTAGTPLRSAIVCVFSGDQEIHSAGDLFRRKPAGMQYDRARPIGEPVRGHDVSAHFAHVDTGELTVCAVNYDGDLRDRRFLDHVEDRVHQLPIGCRHVAATARLVELEVSPVPRLASE